MELESIVDNHRNYRKRTDPYVHFFKVKAPDATSTLNITVKDEFGHTWTEEMKRPKAFSTDAYMQ